MRLYWSVPIRRDMGPVPPRTTGSRTASAAGVLVLVLVAVTTLLSGRPPSPVPASAPDRDFSAERALGYLREFATEPRPLGSPASDRARDYLAGALRSAGFSVRIDRAVGGFTTAGIASFGRVDNIVATLPGGEPTGSVVLAAHYDSVVGGPGASDDGAAIAAMLETVRALRTGDRLRNDLVLLITDGEERGLLGAAAFGRRLPPLGKTAVVLNWEARGVSGPSLMFETSPHNAALVALFVAAAPYPNGDSSLVELYRLLPNNTDFTEFAGAGLAGMNFAYIEGAARYHTPGDTIANLDPASLQHHGANMLGLTRALGNGDLSTLAADHDATYFRVFRFIVSYPIALARPLALLAALALAALVMLARRRGLLSIPRLMLATTWVLLPLITAVAMAQGLWWLLLAVRPDYAQNPFLYRPQLYQVAIAALAACTVWAWYLPLRRRIGPAALAAGGLVWLMLLGALSAALAPGTSHLFTLPALGCATGGLVALLLARARCGWPAAALTVGATPAVVLLMPLGVDSFEAAGLATGGAVAALLTLFGLTLLPLVESLLPVMGQPRGRRRTALAALTGATLVATLVGAGLAVDRVDPAHPVRSDLTYLLDTDTGQASWLSHDAEPGGWVRRYVRARSDDPERTAGLADGPVWLGPAPAVPAPAPEVTLRSRQSDTIELHVSSRRSASSAVLRVNQRVEEVTVAAPGLVPTGLRIKGTLPGRWPAEVHVGDLPPEGIDVTLRISPQRPLRIAAYDLVEGLSGVPGFVPRPPGTERPPRASSDAVVVTRTYQF